MPFEGMRVKEKGSTHFAPRTSNALSVYFYPWFVGLIHEILTRATISSSFFCFTHIYFPASGHAVVTGVLHSPPRFLPTNFIAHRVQQSHCSSIFHRVLLTHALALSASQFVHKKTSPRIYTSMRSGGFELTELTHTRLEDNLIHHRGVRLSIERHEGILFFGQNNFWITRAPAPNIVEM